MEGAVDTSHTAREVWVSRLSWCNCGNTKYAKAHLQIQRRTISLESDDAAAVSYAIGDFERRHHVFGHMYGDEDQTVQMTFGNEWDIEDLKASLVHLSKQHGGLWLDQLSIPQDPVIIPLHLQKVPEIYRRLKMIVLWPHSPCSCLEDAVAAYKSGDKRFIHKDGDLKQLSITDACLNAIPVSSYHFRLWTKHEFEYARRITIYYCSRLDVPCSRDLHHWVLKTASLSETQQSYMSIWARSNFQQYIKQANS